MDKSMPKPTFTRVYKLTIEEAELLKNLKNLFGTKRYEALQRLVPVVKKLKLEKAPPKEKAYRIDFPVDLFEAVEKKYKELGKTIPKIRILIMAVEQATEDFKKSGKTSG